MRDLISLASIEFFAQLQTIFRFGPARAGDNFNINDIATAASANLRISDFLDGFAVRSV
jgi:hypothetical protein